MEQWNTELQQSPYRPNYLWAAIVFGLLVVVLVYGLDWQLACAAFFVVLCSIVLTALRPAQRLKGCVALVGVGIVLVVAMPNCGPHIAVKARNAETKANLHNIQLEIERYACDQDYYPVSIQVLMADGKHYPDRLLPVNPYRRIDNLPNNAPWILDQYSMHPVNETGWPTDHSQIVGDFLYLPHVQQLDGELVAIGYDLIAFGKIEQSKMREVLFPVSGAVPILHFTNCIPASGAEPVIGQSGQSD